MSFDATLGVETRARKRRDANAGEAIPGLLNDIVVTHILRREYFDDPADLARLPAVSRVMRDAVAATRLRFEDLDEYDAVKLGCLSALLRLDRGGHLSRRELLCFAAARGGHLEELQALRADGCPWDADTCSGAVEGGHLDMLHRARANGCPWEEDTCTFAAYCGHLEVLQWARAIGCLWVQETCVWAAEGGHLEVLQWLRANGCPWNAGVLRGARANGHLELENWAMANGCPEEECKPVTTTKA